MVISISNEIKNSVSKRPGRIKHKAKDSVFTDLFGNMKYLFQLYRALHPEDKKATEADIVNVTLKNVLTNNIFNDLGFRIGNRIMILVEAQSTWTVNIIIRMLMYLMQTYNQYYKDINADLYDETKVDMPEPELYVIYTGKKKNVPEYITLQNEFFGGKDIAINAKVKVITASKKKNIINQYISFTKILDEQVTKFGRTREAIEETIKICKDKNVLKEYLASREKEVIDIMISLFDEQEVMDRYIANRVRESEIKATVDDYQFLGKSIKDAIERVASKFGLSEETAKTKVSKYWN